MKTTGFFISHDFPIKYKKHGEPVYIIPFGDIHWGAPLCHKDKFNEFLAWAKKKERCYFLGMGDYFDISSTSERAVFSNRAFHDSTKKSLEHVYKSMADEFSAKVGFMKGRLIGLLEGNHYSELSSGITTTQYICEKLNCKYLGVSAFISLHFHAPSKCRYKKKVIEVVAHHGLGGGRTSGSSVNKLEHMAADAEADIFLMGHDHKKSIVMDSKRRKIYFQEDRSVVVPRKTILCRTGSFLQGYVSGEPSYIADSALPPTDLGVVKIEITPQRRTIGKLREIVLDIHASS